MREFLYWWNTWRYACWRAEKAAADGGATLLWDMGRMDDGWKWFARLRIRAAFASELADYYDWMRKELKK